MTQPAVFFGHGSPMNALGGPFADAWGDSAQARAVRWPLVLLAGRR